MKYYSEIQGLRAVAVLSVIFAHLGVEAFSGGFVGVDIFFVISGYLITGLLKSEYEKTGTIGIVNFYKKRARRIFPAMLATCFLVMAYGYFTLSQERFEQLIDSMQSALFSVSNFYFWSKVDYFDVVASSKPLLHTWSLGVEEQFYLVWPFFIAFILGKKNLRAALIAVVVISILSFALNAVFIDFFVSNFSWPKTGLSEQFSNGQSTAFYLMPFRIFEFGIGAFLTLISSSWINNNRSFANFIFLTGLAGIAYFVVRLDESSIFPYWNALFIATSTGLAIFSAKHSVVAKYLLANKIMMFVGGMSYSLYLVHWPIIVYYRFLHGDMLNVMDILILLSLIFVLAFFLCKCVERPFRHGRWFSCYEAEFSRFFNRLLIPICLLLVAITGMLLKYADTRIPAGRAILTNQEVRNLERKHYCGGQLLGFPRELFTCQNDRSSKNTIIVWGDSHAMHLIVGLSETFPDTNIAIAYFSDCTPQTGFGGKLKHVLRKDLDDKCRKRNHQFLQWSESIKAPQLIFLSSAKRDAPEIVAAIYRRHIEMLEQYGHYAYVLGDFVRPGAEIAECRSVPDLFITDEMLSSLCKPDEKKINQELRYNIALEKMLEKYIPVHKIQCPNNICGFFDTEQRVTYRDDHHLSPFGSIFEIRRVYTDIISKIEAFKDIPVKLQGHSEFLATEDSG
jgi:peptidoglycan/LPS O-acetylase OafA/YrhL